MRDQPWSIIVDQLALRPCFMLCLQRTQLRDRPSLRLTVDKRVVGRTQKDQVFIGINQCLIDLTTTRAAGAARHNVCLLADHSVTVSLGRVLNQRRMADSAQAVRLAPENLTIAVRYPHRRDDTGVSEEGVEQVVRQMTANWTATACGGTGPWTYDRSSGRFGE